MTVDVDALKGAVDIVAVVGSIVPLKKSGNEWLGRCQSGEHEDNNPSMYVNPRKGLVHCFSCGWSTDVIGFVQHTQGLDFKAACAWLGAKPQLAPALSAPPRIAISPRITSKPPVDAESPDMLLRALGAPTRIWPYRDAAGELLGYVARYDGPDGKEIRCWTWGSTSGTEPRWACGHWTAPRPLYGLDRLAEKPDAPVLIAEGEKAADAARGLLPAYVAISWPGGASAVRKVDWSPLANRKVLLWPDADEAGWRAMQAVAATLHDPVGLACAVRIIDPTQMPPGWDAADADAEGWTTDKVIEWARPRAADYVPVPPTEAQDSAAPDPSPTPSPPRPSRPVLAAVDGQRVAAVDADDPLPMGLSEAGIALEFANTRCADMRYCHEWNAWLVWDGQRWRKESNRQTAMQRMIGLSYGLKYRDEARDMPLSSRSKLERKQFIVSVLSLAEFDRRVAISPMEFDSDPMLLGTPAGTVDLSTGLIRKPRPEDYITRTTTIAPVPGPHPLWDSVIDCASSGDKELADFVWRWLGYILTGSVQEEAFLFLFGKAASGKSTFVEAIAGILGDSHAGGYAVKAPVELFTETKNERSGQFHILHGARFAHASETEENRHWKAALLKEATGGDTLSGERKYENVFQFKPSHKLLVHGNFRPHMRSADDGIKRRMHLLEYKGDIAEDKRDLTFKTRLVSEYPAILASMIQHCIAWQKNGGLRKPHHIVDSVSEYFEDEDTIGIWLTECTRQVQGALVGTTDAYQAYQSFCDTRGERAPSHKRFSMMMKTRGFEIKKSGKQNFIGLELLKAPGSNQWQPDPNW